MKTQLQGIGLVLGLAVVAGVAFLAGQLSVPSTASAQSGGACVVAVTHTGKWNENQILWREDRPAVVTITNASNSVSFNINGNHGLVDLAPAPMAFAQNPACAFSHMFGSPGEGPGQFQAGLWDLTIGPDGSIYVADGFLHRVQVFDSRGKFQRMWGSYGTGPGQFTVPRGIAVDPSGRVYVIEGGWATGRVQVFDARGTLLSMWTTKRRDPQDIVVDGKGNLYLPNMGFIEVYGANGQLIREWEVPIYATSLAVARDAVYVTQYRGDFPGAETRVLVFNTSGRLLRSWGSRGRDRGQFLSPVGIAVFDDTRGNVYVFVGDRSNNRVQVFDAAGQFLTMFGSEGRAPGQFLSGGDMELAVDASGNVYVADEDNRRIQVFSCSGITPPGPSSQLRLVATPNPALVGKTISFNLTNEGSSALQLPNAAPWRIVDSANQVVAQGIGAQVITEVAPGGTLSWTWDQKNKAGNQVPPGDYSFILTTLNGDPRELSVRFSIQGTGTP